MDAARDAANVAPMSDDSVLILDDDPDVGTAARLLLQRRVGTVRVLQRPSLAPREKMIPASAARCRCPAPAETPGGSMKKMSLG